MTQIVKESFISKEVLPRENLLCWFKFRESAKFELFVIEYNDKDNAITDFQFKNILQPVMVKMTGPTRSIVLFRKHLLLDGFLGFTCSYNVLPGKEIPISFKISFISDSKIEQVSFETKIIRPIIELLADEKSIKVPEKKLISNKGLAQALNVTLFANPTSKNINVDLKSIKREKIIYGLFKKKIITNDLLLEITGKGSGSIQLVAKYYDEIGNQYETLLEETPITIGTSEKVTIPISMPLPNQIFHNDDHFKITRN